MAFSITFQYKLKSKKIHKRWANREKPHNKANRTQWKWNHTMRKRSFQYEVLLQGKKIHYRKHLLCNLDGIQGETNSPQQDRSDCTYSQTSLRNRWHSDRKVIFQGLGDQGMRVLDFPIIHVSPHKKVQVWEAFQFRAYISQVTLASNTGNQRHLH